MTAASIAWLRLGNKPPCTITIETRQHRPVERDGNFCFGYNLLAWYDETSDQRRPATPARLGSWIEAPASRGSPTTLGANALGVTCGVHSALTGSRPRYTAHLL